MAGVFKKLKATKDHEILDEPGDHLKMIYDGSGVVVEVWKGVVRKEGYRPITKQEAAEMVSLFFP